MSTRVPGRRNIASREDIPADALRQRRDLYALAIALLVYSLAGGYIVEQVTLGALLPFRLKHPWVLLVAAWVGFFYFWLRFWLVSEARPFHDFAEDARWQAGHSRSGRTLAAKCTIATTEYGHKRAAGENAAQLLKGNGPIAKLFVKDGAPKVSLDGLMSRRNRRGETNPGKSYGQLNDVKDEDRFLFYRARLIGFWRATYRERSFSDYTLPHCFAILTVAAGIYHALLGC